jgi:S-DNA-T family DNA segregation ATPase FtsK/SpoIIIE
MHELVLVSGPDKGRVFRLEEGQTLVIGRGQASDTQINDPSISRVHCRAIVDSGAVRIVDAGSSTGIIVNGEKTARLDLKPGDVFQLGDSQVRYQLESTAEASTLVSPTAKSRKNASSAR